MPRTITYSPKARKRNEILSLQPGSDISIAEEGKATESDPRDGYLTKLVKYIPGETLGFYAPISQTAPDHIQIAVLLVASIGTLLYLNNSARKLKKEDRPMPHYYLLAIVSFLIWALNINDHLAKEWKIEGATPGVILACTVYFLPLVDEWLASLNYNRKSE